VPTMLAVTVYSIFVKKWNYEGIEQKGYEMIFANSQNTTTFLLGNLIAFVVAIIAIKFFIGIIQKYGFRIWGWYRIVVGLILIAMIIGGAI
jgi:undecaprenyl-diphosphatase